MSFPSASDARKLTIPARADALAGRSEAMAISNKHYVLGTALMPPFPDGLQTTLFGMGCFWGAEKLFWQLEGVYSTAVGYAGGYTPNATYEEVCSGLTGHNEVVNVVYDPQVISYQTLLQVFWENHNPTEGMKQGNDIGTQYRSAIYPGAAAQITLAEQSLAHYQQRLAEKQLPAATTEIVGAVKFYYAEDYHQQYLAKNPAGYCPNHACSYTGLPRF
jgi:peptide-methionine (S)-S-oxide reductase